MDIKTPYQSIVLMGQTGCGKGTQAALLAEAFNYKIFSTGDKTREYSAMDTPLGHHIASIGPKGWIPEWLASYVMTKGLLEDFVDEGLVYESVARKPEEARKLDAIHEAVGRSYIVIYLNCNDDTVYERQLARGREGYDSPDKIKSRMQAFEDETRESLEFFAEKEKLVTIDAEQPIEAVFDDIIKVVAK